MKPSAESLKPTVCTPHRQRRALAAGLLAAGAALITWVALAQTPPPGATAPATATPAVPPVPPASCTPPRIPERFSVALDDVLYLQKQAGIYRDCVSKYIDEHRALAEKYGALAQAEANAANQAATDVNDFYARVKKVVDANKPKGQ